MCDFEELLRKNTGKRRKEVLTERVFRGKPGSICIITEYSFKKRRFYGKDIYDIPDSSPLFRR